MQLGKLIIEFEHLEVEGKTPVNRPIQYRVKFEECIAPPSAILSAAMDLAEKMINYTEQLKKENENTLQLEKSETL